MRWPWVPRWKLDVAERLQNEFAAKWMASEAACRQLRHQVSAYRDEKLEAAPQVPLTGDNAVRMAIADMDAAAARADWHAARAKRLEEMPMRVLVVFKKRLLNALYKHPEAREIAKSCFKGSLADDRAETAEIEQRHRESV